MIRSQDVKNRTVMPTTGFSDHLIIRIRAAVIRNTKLIPASDRVLVCWKREYLVMNIREREVYRYLGYRNQEPDARTRELIQEVSEELLEVVSPKSVAREFHCTIGEHTVFLRDETTEFVLKSKNLSYNLKNCEYVVLFAATLGHTADKLMMKYEITNMAKASITQAVAAELIESYCNDLQEQIRSKWEKKGYCLRPRFSPGYGDLALEYQKLFFDVLSCEKRIGLTLTDTLLMLPTKSVTALIGITKDKDDCNIAKCHNCTKKDCEYRDED